MIEQHESPWHGPYKIPWHEAGFSRRMLREHLDQEHDLASRRLEWIMKQVEWIHRDMLGGKAARILDLCCGPGFYAHRLAARGHRCHGIDFGPASIEYAHEHNPDETLCTFALGDAREVDLGGPHDLAMLLYGELNVFAPDEIKSILGRMRACLAPDGRLIVEPQTFEVVQGMGQAERSEQEHESGLFSDRPHRCITESRWLAAEKVAIQTFTITDEAGGEQRIYRNTTKAWTDDELRELIASAGFRDVSQRADWPCNTDALALWTANIA